MRRFTVINFPQGGDDWLGARSGRLTASKAKDAIYFLKSGDESASRRDYRIQLVAERLTGTPCDAPVFGDDIDRGVALEPEARAAYELQTGNLVQAVGFCQHLDLLAGCSPDGVVNDFEGLVEIKAPRPANHLRYLRAGTLPAEHYAQCIHSLWITGAEWIDFVSYSPVFPEELRLFVVRLNSSESAIADYSAKAEAFLEEVEAEVEAVKALRAVVA